MKFVTEAVARKESGKGVARQIRMNGRIPGVMYGRGESHMLEMDPAAIRKILMAQAGSTGLISLRILDGEQESQKTAVIQDYQLDPITSSLLHVDLLEVDMNKPIRVKVQVHITGSIPVGVKVDKGVMHHLMRELHIECLPGAMPDQIDIDASELGLGQGVHVRDVQPGEGIKILDDPHGMVVNVTAQISDAKLAAMLTGEGGGVAPVSAEVASGDKAKADAASGKSTEAKK
ncbi:MAG: 50S ribosomal protein L25 [Nitrospirae bacterium]|nr:50S ribosomal protein L25 [Nitrospirota bacterium]MDA1302723.1 50S ribosomal protein L25 [Nitrospirota bacterium]